MRRKGFARHLGPNPRVAAVGAGVSVVLASVMAAVAGPAAGVAAAAASCAPVGSAWQYGLFTSGDAFLADTDSAGPVAIGGNGSLTSFTADQAGGSTANSGTALVVGGTLTTTNGGSADGEVFVGSPPIVQNSGGFSYHPPLLSSDPLNFAGELAGLQSISANLATQATTAGASITAPASGNGNTLTLTGAAGAGLDVFNLTGAAGADLLNAQTIHLVGTAAGATVVVNTDVTSFNATTHLMSTQSGNTPAASQVVWNFADAATITLSNAGWYGTILAPRTTLDDATFSQIDGTVLVSGNIGTSANPWTGQIMAQPFTGCLPLASPPVATPEGLPLALGGSAIALAGGAVYWARRCRPASLAQAA